MASKVGQQQPPMGDPKSSDEGSLQSSSAATKGSTKVNPKEKLKESSKGHHDQSGQGMKKLAISSSQQVISSTRAIPYLQDLLQSISSQREQILKLINSIDPTFRLGSDHRSMEEHKLLNQIAELQGKILSVSEELHVMKLKNAQLENQLTKKEETCSRRS